MLLFRPLLDRVLVRRAKPDTMIGQLIANPNQKPPLRGTVLAAGPGRHHGPTFVPMHVKPGDVVMFGEFAGTPIRINGESDEELLVFLAEELLGVLEEDHQLGLLHAAVPAMVQ